MRMLRPSTGAQPSLALAAALAIAPSGAVQAEDSVRDTITLSLPSTVLPETPPERIGADLVLDTGDRLIDVEILAIDDQIIRLRHDLLGELTLPRSRVVAIYALEPIQPAPTPAAPPTIAAAPQRAVPLPEPARAPWKTSLEFGVSGNAGLTEAFNGRAAASVTRDTSEMETRFSARYRYRTQASEVTANDFNAAFRNDWLLPGSPWGYFVDSSGEYNEFRDYDLRLAGAGGFRYELVNTDNTAILARAGMGGAREFGGVNDRLFPEATLGLRLTHKINSRLSFNTYGDYLPDLADTANFRLVTGAALEVALNDDKTMKLKAGVEDTFESQPGSAEAHDVDYFLSLVLSF